MSRQDTWKSFIKAVYRKEQQGRQVTVAEVAEELYGGDPSVQAVSGQNIVDECKRHGLLTVSIDYQSVQTTAAGLRFIGKP